MATRRRLDVELVRRGMAPTRTAAQSLIDDGQVLVGGANATKASRMVEAGDAVVILGPPPRFVGRGGEKLAGALEAFELDPAGLLVLDAGASTGGFTDCLLQAGAREVVALDVGHGQLHERLRVDARVAVVERTNLRHIRPDDLGPFDAAVADLSFISLTVVMDVLVGCVRPGGWLVLLVKPQFEAGREEVSRGRGVVTDPQAWAAAIRSVLGAANLSGATMMGAAVSPLTGGEGNVEFLVHVEVPAETTAGDTGTGGTGAESAGQGERNGPMIETVIERVVEEAVARHGGAP